MAATPLHNFLFADISGYSRLSELGGDDVAADVAIRFASLVAEMAPEHGALVVKRLGDAVMLHAECAAGLISLGLRLHEELGSLPPIHVGIHSGCAVERAGDWWGCTVNIAARIADAAGAGQLLVTEATRRAAGHQCPASLRGLGALQLKNISVPIKVYEAVPRMVVPRMVVPARKRSARRRAVPDLAPQLSLFERDRLAAGELALEG